MTLLPTWKHHTLAGADWGRFFPGLPYFSLLTRAPPHARLAREQMVLTKDHPKWSDKQLKRIYKELAGAGIKLSLKKWLPGMAGSVPTNSGEIQRTLIAAGWLEKTPGNGQLVFKDPNDDSNLSPHGLHYFQELPNIQSKYLDAEQFLEDIKEERAEQKESGDYNKQPPPVQLGCCVQAVLKNYVKDLVETLQDSISSHPDLLNQAIHHEKQLLFTAVRAIFPCIGFVVSATVADGMRLHDDEVLGGAGGEAPMQAN